MVALEVEEEQEVGPGQSEVEVVQREEADL